MVHEQAVYPGGHVVVGESGNQDKECHVGSGWVVREAVSGAITRHPHDEKEPPTQRPRWGGGGSTEQRE